MLPAERSCGYRQHDQPAEVVIVSLAAQWSTFLHIGKASHSGGACAICNLAKILRKSDAVAYLRKSPV
jgi:hypothetical protein